MDREQQELESKRQELERLLDLEMAAGSSYEEPLKEELQFLKGELDRHSRPEWDELRQQRLLAQDSLENHRLELERLLSLEETAPPADIDGIRKERKKAQQLLVAGRSELESLLHAEGLEAQKFRAETVFEREVEKHREPESKGGGCLGVILCALFLFVLLLDIRSF